MILSRLPTPRGSTAPAVHLASSPAMTNAGATYSQFTISSPSCSRGAFLRPGFATLPRSPRIEGCGWSAERRSGARRNTRNAARSPLGAPPRRFWASEPRFRLLRRPPSYNGEHLPSASVQRTPRSQAIVPGGRLPGPPDASSYEPPPRDATPRSAFRIVSRGDVRELDRGEK
jgi:hypothetical protein